VHEFVKVFVFQRISDKHHVAHEEHSLHPSHIPSWTAHLDARLVDAVGAGANVDFVLLDTVRAIEGFRAQGRTVFVHCVDGTILTPSVAALYSARRRDQDVFQALFALCEVGPDTGPHRELRAALRRLRPVDVTRGGAGGGGCRSGRLVGVLDHIVSTPSRDTVSAMEAQFLGSQHRASAVGATGIPAPHL
jgi:hypothetical protein